MKQAIPVMVRIANSRADHIDIPVMASHAATMRNPPGGQELEEINIEPLSAQQALGAVQQHAFVAQPKDGAHERQAEHEDGRADEQEPAEAGPIGRPPDDVGAEAGPSLKACVREPSGVFMFPT